MNQNEYKDVSFNEFIERVYSGLLESGLSYLDAGNKALEIENLRSALDLTDNKFQADRAMDELSRLRNLESFAEDRERCPQAPVRRPGYRFHIDFEFPPVFTQLELF